MRYWRKIENVSNQKVEMGGCSELSQQSGFCPNGLIVDAPASVTRNLDQGRLAKAERRTAQLISCIQPNRVSEMRRNSVASYVKRLISKCVPCEVFTFGSVPLKTYLPDGDIDLTVFSEDQSLKDTWAKEVQHMLQMEENNEHAEFSVKEVQLILAEVKLIKCLVDNIVVDISFNQLGGLCTLCFLEEVDNLISQNHLFKRSIILVKAWCYYESRILGAHHGLISTYALETLVLYIFHVFNNSFTGPLEVLYRFLEFFSIFDWANFCVSLWGPVPICSLPNMAAAPPRKDGGSLLLSKMFLESCGTAYSVSRAAPEIRDSRFISKHFNVVDPLRLNNNLGRSVSKGNFFRIRSAFSLGAQQLATILDCPGEDIVPQLDQFFMNTWDRHGKDCRPDVPLLDSGCSDLEVDSVKLNTLPLHSTSRTKDSHKVLSVPKQKDQDESRSHLSSERSKLWKKQHDDIKRTCRMNIVQTNGTTNHFARTSSSPELTSMSSEVASTSRRNVAKVGDDIVSRSGNSRRMKASGTMENHVANHFNDEPSVRESSSHHSLASGSDHSSGSCVSKPVYSSTTPVVASAHESRQRSMEEQDFVNKLSSTGIQHHGGHAQMPVNLPSHSFVPFPPSIMGYSHHPNYAAPIPANLPSVESEWGSMVNYANGPFSVPFHQQFRPIRVNAEHDQMIRGFNERVVSPESGHVDEHSGFWIDHNGRSNREFDPESEDFSTASSRLLPGSPSASSRTKASSESSWDGKSGRLTNLSRYPVEKKASSIRNSGAIVNSRWEEDGEPVDRTCDDVNGSQRDWDHSPAVESATRIVTSPPLEVNQIPGFVQPQMGSQRSLSPFGPVLAHPGPHHGVVHNPAVLPVAFYPAGSHHHAFVTMVPVPVYNRPSEGSYGAASGHNNLERRKPPYPMNHVPVNRPDEQLSHTDHYDSNSINTSGERSEEPAPDIFSSDFVDHWKNLLYGRFCQESQLGHPFVYPPSTSVPPQVQPQPQPQPQPQVTSTVVSPEQSTTVAHAVPVPAPHPVSAKPAGTSRRYGGHASKQRNGTGTYFPNPNIIKERQSTTTRPYRGDFSHNRNENFEDRGSHWNFNSKPRYNGRSQPRNYYEKPNTKVDRSAPSNFQTDKTWDGPFY